MSKNLGIDMQKFRKPCLGIALVIIFCCSCSAFAETPEEKRARWDRGPRGINVSAYPSPIKEKYKVFAKKCSKCHNIARPVNCDFVLPIEWERYVKRMMRKPGSGISKKDGKEIYNFLSYDSLVRKADLLNIKLNELPDEERKAQEEKIREIHSQYKE